MAVLAGVQHHQSNAIVASLILDLPGIMLFMGPARSGIEVYSILMSCVLPTDEPSAH